LANATQRNANMRFVGIKYAVCFFVRGQISWGAVRCGRSAWNFAWL